MAKNNKIVTISSDMRNIYLLVVIKRVGCDVYNAHVVIADTPETARKMCPSADEGKIWTDKKQTTCKNIGKTNKKSQVVLSSFNAG